MQSEQVRCWLVNWLLFMSVLHLLSGLLMTYGVSLPLFTTYHQTVLQSFGFSTNQLNVLSVRLDVLRLHQWWVNLFGATLQFIGVLLFIVVVVGKNLRSSNIWLALIVAFLLWAPQDIFISSQINLVAHYWVDGITLLLLIPPLLILFFIDRQKNK